MNAVPRETAGGAPPPPREAREFFGDRLGLAQHYVDLLAGVATGRGLLGPREVGRLWERHVLNCGVIHEVIPDGANVADIGSGAGLPGIVLALHRPDLSMTLVEPMLRRSVFLEEAVAALGLLNAVVVRARIEELRGRMDFEAVTARAVAPLHKLVRWTMPVLRPGGMLVAVKGESAMDEVGAAARELDRRPVWSWEIQTFGAGVVEPPTRAVVVAREQAPDQAGTEPRER